ncbi:glycosyltransferase family 2 protein [Thermococcus sp. M39]|nr:glycosyltransferase family 2 protein [Thermococcus sp. M39]NJE11952.1 glycosyltransferase family 2 protein [Thermococcus sp. LS2]
MPRVSIIILNWNGWKDTIECLESLYRINYPNYDVIVVDNGSQDDSVQKIKEYCAGKIEVNSKFFEYSPYNKPIKVFEISEDDARQGKFNRSLYEKYDVNRRLILIRNKGNYGFAGGNNIGIKFALSVLNPEYILLLNNDTVVDRNFLIEMVKVAESDEKIGVVGPKIYYYDMDSRIAFTISKLILWKGKEKRYGAGEIDKGQWNKITEGDKIEGSCMLIKKEVFSKIGFFDEKFFCYWEETDLCFRAKRNNYKLIYVPTAKIWHKIAASSGGKFSPFYIYYMTRNRLWFLRKHTLRNFKINLLYTMFFEIWFKTAIYLIYKKYPPAFINYFRGILDGILKHP